MSASVSVASGWDFFTAATAVLCTAAAAGLQISTVVSSVVGEACEAVVSALGDRVCLSCIRLGRLLAVRLSHCGQHLLACDRIVQLMLLVCVVQGVGGMDPAGGDVHAAAVSSAAATLALTSVVAGAVLGAAQPEAEPGDSALGHEDATHDGSSHGDSIRSCRYCEQSFSSTSKRALNSALAKHEKACRRSHNSAAGVRGRNNAKCRFAGCCAEPGVAKKHEFKQCPDRLQLASKFRALWVEDGDIPQVCQEKVVHVTNVAHAWRRVYKEPFNLDKLGFQGPSAWADFVEACWPFLHPVNDARYDGVSVAWLFAPPGQSDDWKSAPKSFTKGQAGVTKKMLQGHDVDAAGKSTSTGSMRADHIAGVEAAQFLRRADSLRKPPVFSKRQKADGDLKGNELAEKVGSMPASDTSKLRRNTHQIPETPSKAQDNDPARDHFGAASTPATTRKRPAETGPCRYERCESCPSPCKSSASDSTSVGPQVAGRRWTMQMAHALSELGTVRHVDLVKMMQLFPKIAKLQQQHDDNFPRCEAHVVFRSERFVCGDSVFEMTMNCDCDSSLASWEHIGVGEHVDDAAAQGKRVFTSNALAVLNTIAMGGTLQNLNQLLAGMGHPPLHKDTWEREDAKWHDIAMQILEEECERNILYEAAASRKDGIFVMDSHNHQQIALEVSTDGEI